MWANNQSSIDWYYIITWKLGYTRFNNVEFTASYSLVIPLFQVPLEITSYSMKYWSNTELKRINIIRWHFNVCVIVFRVHSSCLECTLKSVWLPFNDNWSAKFVLYHALLIFTCAEHWSKHQLELEGLTDLPILT